MYRAVAACLCVVIAPVLIAVAVSDPGERTTSVEASSGAVDGRGFSGLNVPSDFDPPEALGESTETSTSVAGRSPRQVVASGGPRSLPSVTSILPPTSLPPGTLPPTSIAPPTIPPTVPPTTLPGSGGGGGGSGAEDDRCGDWPQPYGDGGNGGNNGKTCRISAMSVTTLRPTWTSVLERTDGSHDGQPGGHVAVADGRVFVMSGGKLRAARASDGHQLWVATLPAAVRTGVTVSGTRAIVGADDGYFYGVDVATGVLRWRWDGVLPGEDRFGVSAVAKADAGLVVLAGNGVVSAVDPLTGGVRWTRHHPGRWSFTGAAGVSDGRVILASSSAERDGPNVLALSLGDGTELWQVGVGWGVLAGVTQGAGRAFVADQRGWIHALDARTGRRLWTVSQFEGSGFSVVDPPALVAGRLIGANPNGVVFGLDQTTGRVLWSRDSRTAIPMAVAVTNDVVLAYGHSSGVVAMSLQTGERLSQFGDRPTAVVAVANDSVFVAGRDDNDYRLWRFEPT